MRDVDKYGLASSVRCVDVKLWRDDSFDHPLARLPFGFSLATHLAPTPLHTLASHEPWNSAKSDVTSSAFYPGLPLELALPA